MFESTTVSVGLDVHARSVRFAAVRAEELLEERTLPYDEEAFGDSLDDHLERLAFFYARGGDLDRSLDYLERAASRASSLSAHTQAVNLWSRAARIAEKINDPESRKRIEQRLVELSA